MGRVHVEEGSCAKVEHISFNGVVHRLVTSSRGARTVSCDLEFNNAEFDENEMTYTDHHLTCVECVVLNWRAAALKSFGTRSGRMSARRNNL